MGVQYIGYNSPDGASFGQTSTDKISFHGATPVDKPGSTEDLKDLLVAYGLVTDGGATPLNLDSGALTVGTFSATDDITMTDAKNIVLQSTTGTKVGSASTQKLGFLGATPINRQAATTDLKDLLVAFGFITDSGVSPLNLDSGDLTCLNINMANDMTITDAGNVILASTTGSQLGTVSTQKLGFLGATPANRQAATTDIKDLLVTFGLITDSGASALNLDGGTLTAATVNTTDQSIYNDLTFSDAGNIIIQSTTGTQLGTVSTNKLGFLGATPIGRQAATTDLKDLLVAFGFITDSGVSALNLDGGALTTGTIAATDHITITDAKNVVLQSTTGSQIGTVSTQKLGFLGATPVARTAFTQTAIDTSIAFSTTPFGFTSSQANGLIALGNEMRAVLITLGFKATA